MAKRKTIKKFTINKSHISKDYKHPPQLISTPRGHCPVDLTGTTDEEISTWVKTIKKTAVGGMQYTVNAIQYWVRDFYDPRSDEWKLVRSKIFDLREELELKWLAPPKVSQEAYDRYALHRGHRHPDDLKKES